MLTLLSTGWGIGVNTTTYTMDAYPKIVGISFVGVRIAAATYPALNAISLLNVANPFTHLCAGLSDSKYRERDSPLYPHAMD